MCSSWLPPRLRRLAGSMAGSRKPTLLSMTFSPYLPLSPRQESYGKHGEQMRLIELEPRWIHPNLFLFKCPHCQKDLLSCKNVIMSFTEQQDLFEKTFGENWPALIVGCKDEMAWSFNG